MQLRGKCHALFVFDVGFSIDLDRAQQLVATESTDRRRFRNERRAPQEDYGQPLPLRLSQQADPIAVGAHRTLQDVELVLWDFGAAGVTYTLAVEHSIEDLVDLSDALYDHEELLADARRRVAHLTGVFESAIQRPKLAEQVEDYVIFHLYPPEERAAEWVAKHRGALARVLRGEKGELSAAQVDDALSQSSSYRPSDMALIDWFAAVLIGNTMEDERAVLEYAVVELLELRLLDASLDRRIEDSYELAARPRGVWGRFVTPTEDLWRVAQMQADSAMLFEGVNNAAKLLGDQYLALLYRVASKRFHLESWDTSIERKLAILGSIHERVSSRVDAVRLEVLEWIIILLIAVDIVIYMF